MKFAFVASALVLLPASLAFAPAGSRTVRTASPLNSFFQDLFGDRSDEKEAKAEKKKMKERFGKSIKNDIDGEFLAPTREEEEEMEKELKAKYMSEADFSHMPTKAQTGVDVHITRLAATLSTQVYHLYTGKKDAFMLNTKSHDVEVLISDKQKGFEASNPTFGAVVSGDTLLLGWRGTQSLLDGLNDFAMSPTSNLAMRKHAKNIKLQGAMASLALNDIAIHEDFLIEECKKRGIKEIVTTGHSLGGGIAQIGHTILRAQQQTEGSPWAEIKDINVRSVCFCAPMTHVLLEEGCSEETEDFIEEIDANSCNVVYYNDPVPRGYGYLSFINDVIDDCIPAIGPYLLDGKKFPFLITKRKISQFAEAQADKIMESEAFEDVVETLCNYVHPGKIIFYKDMKAKPQTLRDLGAFDKNAGKKGTFRSVKYTPVKRFSKENPIESALACHGIGRDGVAYDDEYLH